MDNSVFQKKPPEKYIENFVQYVPGFDTSPSVADFIRHGYTMKDAERMCELFRIEAMKRFLEEGRKDEDVSEEELKEFENYIAEKIAKYNKAS
jgi:Arc/MetJ-type ribon-helix-helix transcriptional regulator